MTDKAPTTPTAERPRSLGERTTWVWPAAVLLSAAIALMRVNPVGADRNAYLMLALQLLPIGLATLQMLTVRPGSPTSTPMRAVAWSGVALIAVCAASTLWSTDPTRSAAQACVMTLCLTFLYLTATRRWPARLDRDLTALFAVGSGVVLVSVVVRLLDVHSAVGVGRRLQGVVGNPNYYAMLVTLVVAVGLYLITRVGRSTRDRLLLGAALGLSLLTLLWSGSRGSLLAVLLLLAGAVLVRDVRASVRVAAGPLVLGLAAGVLVGVAAWAVAPNTPPPAATTAHMDGDLSEESGSLDSVFDRGVVESGFSTGRSEIWGEALDLVADRPVLGHGYRTSETLLAGDLTTHNLPLSFLVETGVLGLLAFLALVGSLAWAGFSAARTDLVLLLGCGAVAVQEMVEASLQSFSGPTALPQWLLLFAFAASGARARQVQRQDDSRAAA